MTGKAEISISDKIISTSGTFFYYLAAGGTNQYKETVVNSPTTIIELRMYGSGTADVLIKVLEEDVNGRILAKAYTNGTPITYTKCRIRITESTKLLFYIEGGADAIARIWGVTDNGKGLML